MKQTDKNPVASTITIRQVAIENATARACFKAGKDCVHMFERVDLRLY